MNFSGKFWRGLAVGLTVLLLLLAVRELRTMRRVDAVFQELLKNVENRKWGAVSKSLAPDYHDRWGFNHASVMENLPLAFRHFYALEIKAESPEISIVGNIATVRSRISIDGRGTAIADMVLGRVQALRQPFIFTFRKQSWKPWDWKLETVEQPELDVEAYSAW